MGTVSAIAGKVQTPGFVDGTGSEARFNSPYALALDKSGNLLVADWGNHVIRKVTPAGEVSTLANGSDFTNLSGIAVDKCMSLTMAMLLCAKLLPAVAPLRWPDRRRKPAGSMTQVTSHG